MAKKIHLRMAALLAANSLADFWPPSTGPERCHELKGALKGSFSMDLEHPYRLIFIDASDTRDDGQSEQEYWQSVDEVEITGIEDTHG